MFLGVRMLVLSLSSIGTLVPGHPVNKCPDPDQPRECSSVCCGLDEYCFAQLKLNLQESEICELCRTQAQRNSCVFPNTDCIDGCYSRLRRKLRTSSSRINLMTNHLDFRQLIPVSLRVFFVSFPQLGFCGVIGGMLIMLISIKIRGNRLLSLHAKDIQEGTKGTDRGLPKKREASGATTTTKETSDLDSGSDHTLGILLMKEQGFLEDSLTCLECRSQRLGSLYLPCGHIVACQECAKKATICCSCKTTIVATAKIQLAE